MFARPGDEFPASEVGTLVGRKLTKSLRDGDDRIQGDDGDNVVTYNLGNGASSVQANGILRVTGRPDQRWAERTVAAVWPALERAPAGRN